MCWRNLYIFEVLNLSVYYIEHVVLLQSQALKNFWAVNWIAILFRMECVYRLLYSSLAVQWKSYLMATDSYIFPFLLSPDQECFCMTSFIALTSLGSRVYFSGGTVLRYWYVKSSLKPEITVGVQSRKTLYTCLGIPQLLILLHLLDALIVYNTKENVPK